MTTQQIVKSAVCYSDSARGIYIPQHFAETCDRAKVLYVSDDEWKDLEAGPDVENYWDTWDSVLSNAETTCGGVLYQDGDLWVIYAQHATLAINDLCEDQESYESTHDDAGNNYAHMVAESWSDTDDENLKDQLMKSLMMGQGFDYTVTPQWQHLGIDPRWNQLEIDVLSDYAIESVVMTAGHMFSPDGIVIGIFSVGEIEVCLHHLGIDCVTMDFIRESCDAYISGTDVAYVSTDAVWYAIVDPETFNAYVQQHFDGLEGQNL